MQIPVEKVRKIVLSNLSFDSTLSDEDKILIANHVHDLLHLRVNEFQIKAYLYDTLNYNPNGLVSSARINILMDQIYGNENRTASNTSLGLPQLRT